MDNKIISDRFEEFMKIIGNEIEMSLPVKMMVLNMKPQILSMLSDPERQQDVLNLIQLIGWVMGYRVTYEHETDQFLESV